MEIEKPAKYGFTIYSKSGCPDCIKAKHLLKEKYLKVTIIDSDEYIIEDKLHFLLFINELTNAPIKTFPIIFFDQKFIGGYNETVTFVSQLLLTFEDSF